VEAVLSSRLIFGLADSFNSDIFAFCSCFDVPFCLDPFKNFLHFWLISLYLWYFILMPHVYCSPLRFHMPFFLFQISLGLSPSRACLHPPPFPCLTAPGPLDLVLAVSRLNFFARQDSSVSTQPAVWPPIIYFLKAYSLFDCGIVFFFISRFIRQTPHPTDIPLWSGLFFFTLSFKWRLMASFQSWTPPFS